MSAFGSREERFAVIAEIEETAAHGQQTRDPTGQVRTAISNGLVNLLKEYYGRGPSQAKTYYTGDLVVCLLRGGFTPVEQTLLESGRSSAVIAQRMEFQEAMRDRFKAVVTEATGRGVVGFMSGNQQDPDMICEVFVLSPSDLVDGQEELLAGEGSTA